MLKFCERQDRVIRIIRENKYKFILLGILICIILNTAIHSIFFDSPKISYKVVTQPPTINATIEDFRIEETQDFLINTPGCYIPNYAKKFKYKRSVKEFTNIYAMCGVRRIFIDTIGVEKIKFRMYKYTEEAVTCCYQYVFESTMSADGFDRLSHTPCEVFTNNSKAWLLQEVITVTCRKNGKIIYEDIYLLLKKNIENNNQLETDNKTHWNVLMIGLESMSRTRLFDTMPRTTKYLKKHKWLDFKAYQKVYTKTFQNLMSVLTGKRMSTDDATCKSDLYKLADYFIWKKYKDAGYITAYGESNLRSDTFGGGFKTSPTDHYMRLSFFSRTCYSGNILCTGKKPSATQLLQYFHKFVDSYKPNAFFGLFWISTYASFNNTPELSDREIVNYFKKLNRTGVLNNTFVIFFSDQGTSFGEMTLLKESHYENQLPMLFIWTPFTFRQQYINEHHNLRVNQDRLITPYDVYITLADILKLSSNSREEIKSEGCEQCTSLLAQISANRTCTDISVGEYWCSCHNMSKIDTGIKKGDICISVVKASIKRIWNSIKTVPCTSCAKLKYFTVIRAHEYQLDEKTYYIIAFHLSPNEMKFEAVVEHYSARFRVLSLRALTRYNNLGNCALLSQDRPFCVCAFDTSCIPKSIVKPVKDMLDPSFVKLNHGKPFDNFVESLIMSL